MSGIIRYGDYSAGHDCYPPTPCLPTTIKRIKVNGKVPAVIGDEYEEHTCDEDIHAGADRKLIMGSTTVFFEGIGVCRIDDSIACGDSAAQGSSDVLAG